jgi:gas vesicle protein
MAQSKRSGYILGALVGAVAGVLLAPKTGKELRAQLLESWPFGLSSQRQRLQEAMNAGREQAAERSETLKQKIEETRQRLRDQLS